MVRYSGYSGDGTVFLKLAEQDADTSWWRGDSQEGRRMSASKKETSRKKKSAEEEADKVIRDIKPRLMEMIERNDPAVENLKLSDIEGNSAAVGDLLSKLLIQRALDKQPCATEIEIEEARREALREADPNLRGDLKPEELRMTRMKGREVRLKTVRGEVRCSREYLHFPELKLGLFPPRSASGDT